MLASPRTISLVLQIRAVLCSHETCLTRSEDGYFRKPATVLGIWRARPEGC